MYPFKLRKVRKNLRKIELKREDTNFSLVPFIKRWIREHPPELSYNDNKSDFSKWKQEVKNLVIENLRVLDPIPLKNAKPITHGESEANAIKFIKLSFEFLPGLRVPSILCIPKNLKKKTAAVICIHGHGQSMNNSVGLKKSKSKECFGYELAKQGFITLSPDWMGSGEREKLLKKIPIFLQGEGQLSNWIRFLGHDMIGFRITEMMGLLNYLETRTDVDPTRFGIIGHSGGGTIALFTSLVDQRIKACATSGYFGTWEHSILAMYHCGCNYIGNLREYIELYDVYASLAPLPLISCIGKKDKIFPFEGTKKAIPIIKSAYEKTGAPDNFLIDVQAKGHQFYKEKIYPFLKQHLSQ